MLFSLKLDTSKLDALLDRIAAYYRTDVRKVAATQVIADIEANTARGETPDGKAFKPYNEKTKKRREKKGLQTDPPNLRETGNMIRGLNLNGDVITVAAADEKKAELHQLGNKRRNVPARPFLGAGKKTIERIKGTIIRDIEKL